VLGIRSSADRAHAALLVDRSVEVVSADPVSAHQVVMPAAAVER
jgi:hypothetical protein